jgi:hypothetical protein
MELDGMIWKGINSNSKVGEYVLERNKKLENTNVMVIGKGRGEKTGSKKREKITNVRKGGFRRLSDPEERCTRTPDSPDPVTLL